MAAPVKAFIDPTFLSLRLKDWLPMATPPPLDGVLIRLPTANWNVQIREDWRLPLLSLSLHDGPKLVHLVKIPTPPMGRITVLTFPPIYKEQGGSRIVTGQLYPPRAQ